MGQCCNLRMYPDHTWLLHHNEAYLPSQLSGRMKHGDGVDEAKDVLAMRVCMGTGLEKFMALLLTCFFP
jgi:hypothetical protein